MLILTRAVLVLIAFAIAGFAVLALASKGQAMTTSMAMPRGPSVMPGLLCHDPACFNCHDAADCCSAGCYYVAGLPPAMPDLAKELQGSPLAVADTTEVPLVGLRLDRPPKFS